MHVYDSGNNRNSRSFDLGTLSSGGQLSQGNRVWDNLKPGERYTVRLFAEVGGVLDTGSPFIQRCFQMPETYVDWDGVSGSTGSSSCPGGLTELNSTVPTIVSGSLKAKSIRIMTPQMSVSNLQTYTGRSISFALVSLEVLGPNRQKVGSTRDLGTAGGGQSVSAATTTFSGLKPGTRYAVVVRTPSTPIARRCFHTQGDLSRALGWHDDIQMFAGGCFAGGLTREEIRACLCGARNRAGQWARTDAEDGFEWQISAAERTQQRCDN